MPARDLPRIGLIGCGAMGSAIARRIMGEFGQHATLTHVLDIDQSRSAALAEQFQNVSTSASLECLINDADIIVEAASPAISGKVAAQGLAAGKKVLIMSAGGLIGDEVWPLVQKNAGPGKIFVPSGAIGGLDALSAVRKETITSVTLQTTKSPRGLKGAPYFSKKGLAVEHMRARTKVFSGSVGEAVRGFPQNINVAATLALLLGDREKLRVEIFADPAAKKNIHEVTALGAFGRLYFKLENEPSPDNPKTSMLAVLSAVRTLEKMFATVLVGT